MYTDAGCDVAVPIDPMKPELKTPGAYRLTL